MSKKTLLYVILALFCCSTLIVIGSTNTGTKYHSQDIEKITQAIQTIEGKVVRGQATPRDLERLDLFRAQLAELQDPARANVNAESATVNKQDVVKAEKEELKTMDAVNTEIEDPAKLAADLEIQARQAEAKRTARANATLAGTAVNRAETMTFIEKDVAIPRHKELLRAISEAKDAGDVTLAERLQAEYDAIEIPREPSHSPIRINDGSLDQNDGGDSCHIAFDIGDIVALGSYSDIGAIVSDGTDEIHDITCATYGGEGPDKWYKFTVPAGGPYGITITMDAPSQYPVFGIYDACGGTCLIGVYTNSSQAFLACTEFAAGTYYLICDNWPSPAMTAYDLYISTCTLPTGRCCYNSGVDCADDLTESECDALTGLWLEGETCASAPCFVCTPHHTMTDADQVIDADGTCGDGANLNDTGCLGYYDGGEENIIEWTVTTAGFYKITLNSPTTYTGIALTTECEAVNCLDYTTGYASGDKVISCIELTPGTYYIFIDTWPSPACMTSYTVTTEVCAVGRCCYGTPEALSCADELEEDCLARADDLGWDETLTCATDPCDDLGRCCYGNPSEPSCADENLFACLARTDELSWDGDLDCTTDCPVINGRCCYGDETEPGFVGYDCADETEYECLARADYVSWDETLDCTTPCPLPPVGRCCYGDEWTVSCADEYEALCALRTDFISWDETMDCTTNPCEPVCDYELEEVAATCETAILLTPPVARAGDIADGDFLPTGLPYCGTSANGHVVWYKVIGTGNTMTVNFCDDCNVNFDSIIRVYACACDVDYIHCVGGADYVTCDPATNAVHPGGYTWCTNVGEEYYIVAGAYYSSDVEGEFIIHLTDDGVACAEPVGCPTGRCCYGDPQLPTCAADQTEEACAILGGTGYFEWTEGADCTEACPVIIGRCCYGDPQAPSCADETEYECLTRLDALTWDEGETCAYQGVVVNVSVTDNAFVPADIVVYQGDQVVWTWDAANVNAHNVVSDDGVTFDSGDPTLPPAVFNHTFTEAPGVYTYSCENYGGDPDFMIGSVEVVAAPLNTCEVIIGRCCYGDPLDQSCIDETEFECIARADYLSWDETTDCATEDCIDYVLGQNCDVPILATVGLATSYDSGVLTTCGMVSDCGHSGEDIMFTVTVLDDGQYTFSLCNAGSEDLDDYIYVYSDDCCGSVIAGSNDTGPSADCPNGNAQVTCVDLTAGTYYVLVEHYFSGTCGEVQLTIDACIGRCCYDDPFAPTCADGIGPDACEDLGTASAGGYWSYTQGLDCTTPCEGALDGDYCENAIEVTTLPFNDTYNMCEFTNQCAIRTGKDIHFEVTIPTDGQYEFSTCNPGTGTGDIVIYLWDTECCGAVADTVAYDDDGCATPGLASIIECMPLTAGTYYFTIEQYSSSSTCGPIELTIKECVEWRCCYGDPYAYTCVDTTESACDALGGIWSEGLSCATDPCVNCTEPPANDECVDLTACPTLVAGVPENYSGDMTCALANDCVNDTLPIVWECFELTECSDLTISYCGSDGQNVGSVYIVVGTDCECLEFYYYDTIDWTQCDTNPIFTFVDLPAGVYYHPVHPDRGPNYMIEITSAPSSTGRCCYGDPLDLTCAENMNKCDCDDLGGVWLDGGDCTTNPCPEPCPILLSEYTYYVTGAYPLDPPTTVDIELVVPDNFVIADINVGVDLVHTYDGDVELTLESPTGTFVDLSIGNGSGGDNYECTVFDMDATTSITAGVAPFTGSYIPEGDLTALIGTNSGGTWTLHFVDNFPGYDGGFLYSFALELISGECDPVEDLAIYYDIANLEFDLTWTNPQEAEYKVWSTTNPNNDGDPNDGTDPDWELEVDLGTLPAGPARDSILWADLPTNYANILVTAGGCGPAPQQARCCYNTTECIVTTQDDCLNNYGGTWHFGVNDCTTPPLCGDIVYCEPCFTEASNFDDWITNVTFNTINYTSDSVGAPCQYDDQTALSTTVTQGVLYNLSVSVDGGGAYDQPVRAWFDWNHDGTFDTSTEQYDVGCVELTPGTPVTVNVDITVPLTATVGDTRMRVIEMYSSGCATYPGPCQTGTWGETEDFTVTIVAAP
ncbi:proprotein convertase P-domain-containing protein [bacterium]|nr:proprotein convertase P-domain-containing protein [bacterium]